LGTTADENAVQVKTEKMQPEEKKHAGRKAKKEL